LSGLLNGEAQMAKLTEEQRKVLANSVDEVMREVERANRALEALGVDTQLSVVLTDRTGRPVADDVLAGLSPEQRARLLAAGPG
jgi:ribulose kinase